MGTQVATELSASTTQMEVRSLAANKRVGAELGERYY